MFSVDRSILQARWQLPEIDDRLIEQVRRDHAVPEILARLLLARNVPGDQVQAFLSPRLARDFPDPARLAGMGAAAEFIADLVESGAVIGVFGDFDVDGATSSALLTKFFRHFDLDPLLHIPDRLAEGYGPNAPALLAMQGKGAAAAILCDCGITAFEVLEKTAAANFPVIVLDHHEPEGADLPPAAHVINPKRADDTSGYRMLAAVGVAFLFCVAVNKALRERGYYTRAGRAEPPLKDWLDLVALGTLCDMVPLTGPNRLLVRAGLTQMAARQNVGIRALAQVSKLKEDEPITPMQVGFALGPRINAGGRIHKSDLGSRLLSCEDPVEALRLAEVLDECNLKRREMEQATLQQAIRKVADFGLDRDPVIIVDDPDWHPGLAGLVAGRLKEKYGRPACVVTYAKMGDGRLEGRGSGRSVPGINIAAIFQAARAAGFLVKGGGHAMAGGFTVLPDQVAPFRAFVRDHAGVLMADLDLTPEHRADALAFVRSLSLDVAQLLEDQLGPYGPEHPEPLFVIPSARLHSVDVLGGAHVRCFLSDWDGGGRVKAMAFRAVDTPLGQALLGHGRDQPIHLLGTLRVDRWQGRESPVLFIQDAAHAVADAAGARAGGLAA